MCKKMTGHWRQKSHWLKDNDEPHFPIKEVWDGTRFSELQWFWNPDKEWLLPDVCLCCNSVIPSAEIIAANSVNGFKVVICAQCGYEQDVLEQFTSGDPRNIAFLLHWDGFQPFGDPGYHSTGKLLLILTHHKLCFTMH